MKNTLLTIILSVFIFESGMFLYHLTPKAESAADVRRELVVDFLKTVMRPKVKEFSALALELNGEVQRVCSSDPQALFSLEEKMNQVYRAYGFLEAVKFGALADPVRARDIEINPLFGDFSPCIIDKQVAKYAKNPERFKFDTVRKSRKGLSAIEYLITDQDLNHSCSPRVPQTKNWNDLPAEKKKEFRCGYLKFVSQDLATQGEELLNEWLPERGDLAGDIARNEMGNSSQDLLNQVSDGLYFLETALKANKLAMPLGLKTNCVGKICVQEFERPTLKASMESISENLNAFLSVFIGNLDHQGEKKGFYRLLKDLGRQEVAESIFQNTLSAKTAADLVLERGMTFADIESEGFRNCLNKEKSLMCDIFSPVQDATTVFKTEFFSILNLRKPDGIPVDND